MTKIILVAGARPNFIKIASLMAAFQSRPEIGPLLVHTGQHYDRAMSDLFFQQLGIPEPDVNLGVGSASHAVQTAEIMRAFEPVIVEQKPDAVLVVGDVNSTIACGLVAVKLGVKLIHVEAGLRSFDRTMPEEINRLLTDAISDLLFCSEPSGVENLRREGVAEEKIHLVGNVMIDTLLQFRAKAEKSAKIKINQQDYALLTLHRPSNVDDKKTFRNILDALKDVSKKIPILFPAHPRTQKQIKVFGYEKYFNVLSLNPMNSIHPKNSINLSGPLSYLDFLNLMANSKLVYTDSGGIQEETTILGIPCLTIRENTERPVTIEEGTNILVGSDREKIAEESYKILKGKGKKGRIPKLWDGKASERIVNILLGRLYEPFQSQ